MHWNHVIFHPGNEELKRFIEIGILSAQLGIPVHFHVEGVRGTGKTTLIRAAKNRFPEIHRIAGCLYNCDPAAPHCPQHRESDNFPTETVPMPFLEVSHSAKVGTVVGSIDLDRLTALTNPAAALLPGTIPRANRGIVFVDEINRLADTSPALVDILLDVMGTKPGRVQIEETGLPTVEMPVHVNVWAASNPDEEPGPLQEIRRQLADRFDFVVRIERPDQPDTVRAIMLAGQLAAEQATQLHPVADLTSIELDERVDDFLSNLYIRFRLESIRGVQAIRLGSQLHALTQGKKLADFTDMAAVLPAALRHRISPPRLVEITEAMRDAAATQQRKPAPPANPKGEAKEGKSYRYPSLWRGIWQRLSKSQTSPKGKQVSVQTPQPAKTESPNEEKKTVAARIGPEETGKQ
jgi:magnesium chelatase subunit I